VRSIKMLGVAAVAAMAVMAFIGAASASATTTVCTVSTSPCPSGDAYVGNVSSSLAKHGGSATAVLTSNSLGTVTCTVSNPSGTIGTNPGTPVTGTTTPSFSSCTKSGASCTVSALNTPYSVTISNTPLAAGSNGTFHVSNPDVKVTCGFLSCTYTATAQDASAYNPGNTSAPDTTNSHGQLFYNNVGLTSSNCFNDNGHFTANYQVTTSGGGDLWTD
jgi:hypothetical protein